MDHPVHEVLTPMIIEHKIIIKDIILNHYPDLNKSRSNYLPLLECQLKNLLMMIEICII